jgi:hypothetical protein
MNTADLHHWQTANQAYLMASLAIVRDGLARYVAQQQGQPGPTEQQQDLQAALQQAADDLPSPSALENVCRAFNLSTFERDVLLL